MSHYAGTEILTIDLAQATIILGDGTRVQVTNWIDEDGQDTQDARQAVSCVGQLPDGNWLATQVLKDDRDAARTN